MGAVRDVTVMVAVLVLTTGLSYVTILGTITLIAAAVSGI